MLWKLNGALWREFYISQTLKDESLKNLQFPKIVFLFIFVNGVNFERLLEKFSAQASISWQEADEKVRLSPLSPSFLLWTGY